MEEKRRGALGREGRRWWREEKVELEEVSYDHLANRPSLPYAQAGEERLRDGRGGETGEDREGGGKDKTRTKTCGRGGGREGGWR